MESTFEHLDPSLPEARSWVSVSCNWKSHDCYTCCRGTLFMEEVREAVTLAQLLAHLS